MTDRQLKWDITCTDTKVSIEDNNIQVNEIFGGFGRDQRILTVPQIAKLHADNPEDKKEISNRVKRINELINNNLILDSGDKYFEFGIDILDLKDKNNGNTILFNELKAARVYTQAQIGNSNNLYILSEQGYSLLINLMSDTRSKLIYKNVIRDYFKLKEISLNNKDTEQFVMRMLGKQERKKTTDTIKFFIDKGDLEHEPSIPYKNAYAIETNYIYKLLFGKTAKQIASFLDLDLKSYDTIRNYLCLEDIDDIRTVEGRIAYMAEDGHSYQDIQARLKELYPTPRDPKLADKNISLINTLMLN